MGTFRILSNAEMLGEATFKSHTDEIVTYPVYEYRLDSTHEAFAFRSDIKNKRYAILYNTKAGMCYAVPKKNAFPSAIEICENTADIKDGNIFVFGHTVRCMTDREEYIYETNECCDYVTDLFGNLVLD